MAFKTTRPLRFGDCDPSGIAYFPSYLNILVGVLEDYFATLGFPWKTMIDERRIGVPTVRLDLTFSSPGFQGDELEFAVIVRRIGRASLDLEHQVSARGKILWTATHRVVATHLDTQQSLAWPDDIRAALEHHLEKTDAHDPAA
ncbi:MULTISPECIES: acyl-CoA thioesterase [Rhizobium]|uniref:Thioesterase family protein n=1 Tax=Rhizobium rhododendri TaxID=2506430 RepID=A0ABY8IDT7_9HYPH|nr:MULTISPECIES: thioesterase family protein [Rhizobium]MBZ5758962.1 acyl-CoA thioesterase [Rhizobium sp. VS19-DR96]MBZ5764208.1 acyl-CoA thioesterase [Rhizobium sp. VS19-DR129.2]MBZ5771751.1 acyl-CoA thioesterase [Rhizobium sp. VS19-DRK62.2]MBZ5783562.1 acyl-CoA thioesterase [Rhizobium sp. VS19-DR121]MBZ5801764.1 acyl-CoA thioesterase [Rhizobium sp. VS19-DR181]